MLISLPEVIIIVVRLVTKLVAMDTMVIDLLVVACNKNYADKINEIIDNKSKVQFLIRNLFPLKC